MRETKTLSWFLILACAGCAAPAVGEEVGAEKGAWSLHTSSETETLSMGPIELGASVDGTIGKGEIHQFEFCGKAGSSITIDMRGESWGQPDTYLRLEGPSGSSYADDDSGHAYDASLTVDALPETGTYVVDATTYRNAGHGDYTLSVTCNGGDCACDDGHTPPEDWIGECRIVEGECRIRRRLFDGEDWSVDMIEEVNMSYTFTSDERIVPIQMRQDWNSAVYYFSGMIFASQSSPTRRCEPLHEHHDIDLRDGEGRSSHTWSSYTADYLDVEQRWEASMTASLDPRGLSFDYVWEHDNDRRSAGPYEKTLVECEFFDGR